MEKLICETETDLCRALWLSVFLQQLIDATGKGKTKREERSRIEALTWLSSQDHINSSFAQVCELAGIDPKKASDIVSGILSRTREGVDFRCIKKASLKNRSTENRKSYFTRSRRNADNRKASRLNG